MAQYSQERFLSGEYHEGDVEQASNNGGSKQSSPLSKVSFTVLASLVFLLPIVALPVLAFAPAVLKTLLFVILGLSAGSLALFSAFSSRQGVIPLTYTFLLLGLLVSFVISVLFSSSFTSSLFGKNLELGTFYVSAVAIFSGLTLPLIFTTKRRFFSFFLAFFLSAVVLFLFHAVRLLVGPEFLSLGIFTQPATSPVGSWNDFGIFSGLALVTSLALLLYGSFPGAIRVALRVLSIVALIFVGVVNFQLLTIILLLFTAVFAALSFMKSKKTTPLFFTAFPLVLLVFTIFSGLIGNYSAQLFGTSYVEVRPNVESTAAVARETIDTPVEFLFGAGPNTFTYLWQEARPSDIVESNFWSIDFAYGSGVLPTMFISLGLVGSVLLIGIFAYLLFLGIRFVRAQSEDVFMRSITLAAFFGALLLWILGFVYVFSITVYALMFLFLGLFVSGLVQTRQVRVTSVFDEREREGTVVGYVVLGFALLGLVALVPAFTTSAARVLYAQGVVAYSSAQEVEEVTAAADRIRTAARLETNDAYYRTLADLDLVQMQALLAEQAQNEEGEVQEGVDTQAQGYIDLAISDAQRAVDTDRSNYLNWTSFGLVYETLAALGVDTEVAYQSAASAYAQARVANPTNPELPLMQARLELARENADSAQGFIEQAIAMKTNFADAYLLNAQIALNAEDVDAAVAEIERAIAAIPNTPFLHYELGLVHYFDENYEEAIASFDEALALDQQYANARYFRALSLVYGENNREEALEELEIVLQTNPENESLEQVIANIEGGLDPLAGVSEVEGVEGEPAPGDTTNEEALERLEEEEAIDEAADAEGEGVIVE